MSTELEAVRDRVGALETAVVQLMGLVTHLLKPVPWPNQQIVPPVFQRPFPPMCEVQTGNEAEYTKQEVKQTSPIKLYEE